MEKLGIEKLKELVKAGLGFGQKVSSDLEDKKISLWEALGLIPNLFSIVGVVKSWADIKAEVDDLSTEERKELEDYVISEFDIPNDKVELFIEHSLSLVVSLIALAEEFKHLKD